MACTQIRKLPWQVFDCCVISETHLFSGLAWEAQAITSCIDFRSSLTLICVENLWKLFHDTVLQ